jgi:hypothetical protein
MVGYATYLKFQRIEEQANKLGFRLAYSKYGDTHGEFVALTPLDDKLPPFSRDAELWCGTFDNLEAFLIGWEKSQFYDSILRMTDSNRRKKFEDAEVERQRIAKEKEEQKKMWKALTATETVK